MPSRIQATGCIEVRGEGSVLGQRQGVAMWQRRRLWGDLALTGSGKARENWLPAFPLSLPFKHHLRFGLLKAAIKADLNVKAAQGYSSILLDASLQKGVEASPHC